jgi:hypothetical protein
MKGAAEVSRRSPFRPSFGTNPPLVAGRDAVVAEFADALDTGPGARGRACLFTGNRGIGKTVMLNEAEATAKERGWLVVSETATRGLVRRLTTEGLPRAADLLRQSPRDRTRVSGITLPAGLGGIELNLPRSEPPGGLRQQLDALTDALDPHGTGLLLTLDEVHARAAREDVEDLCAIVQHAFREERTVAFAAAGLPAAVQDLLTSDVSTFLRRARRFVLEPLTPVFAEEALRVPIEAAGRRIGDRALRRAAAATFGYPYLTQVVGDQIWRQDPDAERITEAHVAAGVAAAIREFGTSVHEPALNDLSETDRAFVKAMAEDDGESATGDIAARMGRNQAYISRYRSRLIVAGIIEPGRYGRVRFTIPYLREFVREHYSLL